MNERDSASPIPALTEALVDANDQLLALYELTAVTQTSFDADVVIPEILERAMQIGALNSATFVLENNQRWETATPQGPFEQVIAVQNGTTKAVLEMSRDRPFSTGDRKLMTAVAEVALSAANTSRLHHEAIASAVVERDHDTASELAQLSLPRWRPQVEGVSVFARSDPARKAGGDFYCFAEADQHLCFAVGDVSGKGLPAAITMTTAISAVTAAFATDGEQSPAVVLRQIDTWLHQTLEDASMFITLLIGGYDVSTRTLRLANAGHSPVLFESNGQWEHVDASVPPVGVMPLSGVGSIPIHEHELPMSVGNRLVVASDGFTEQATVSGEFFGEDRLLEALDDIGDANNDNAEAGDKLFERLDAFAAGCEQGDDRTLLILESLPLANRLAEAA